MKVFYLLPIMFMFSLAHSTPTVNKIELVEGNNVIEAANDQHKDAKGKTEETSQEIATAYTMSPKDRLAQDRKASEAKAKALAEYEKKYHDRITKN